MGKPWAKEVEAAVFWWSNQLRGGARQDNGDAIQSIMTTLVASREERPTEAQLARFREALTVALDKRMKESGWDPTRPTWGGAFRTLTVDYSPEPILGDAAREAGIKTWFPIKTCMRIDPVNVQVGLGYRAPFETIYP